MRYIDNLCIRRNYSETLKVQIQNAYKLLFDCYKNGHKVLICGNGGSSADSSHIQGELMKNFVVKRPLEQNFKASLKSVLDDFTKKNREEDIINIVGVSDVSKVYEKFSTKLETGLPTIDLTAFTGLNFAYINDTSSRFVFANAVLGLGKKEDILICISTSGNSKNVVNAALVAKAKGLKVITLTGRDGGILKGLSDVCIIANENDTYLIQEEHIAIYHALCLDIEENYFTN